MHPSSALAPRSTPVYRHRPFFYTAKHVGRTSRGARVSRIFSYCIPLPMSHPSMRPRRAAAARTNAAIDASLRVEAQTTRLGKMKKI